MDLGTVLKEGLQVLVLGMGTTFVGLALLIFVIEAINKIVNRNNNSNDTTDKEDDSNTEEEVESSIDDNNVNDEELAAVISAAIAMMLDNGSQPLFRIKRITQIPASTPQWNQLSRREQLLNRQYNF